MTKYVKEMQQDPQYLNFEQIPTNSSISIDEPNTVITDHTTKLIGQFFLGKTLGQGTFGKVKLGTHTITGEKVAIKILEKVKILDNADKLRVDREIKILKSLMHHNIIQIYSVIETPTNIFLIMEYASGGELFNIIVLKKRLSELEACKFFHQMIDAVDYLHKLGVVHRDLKPENLLLDHNRDIKLVDFGLSTIYTKGELLKTPCGSPCYAAPEMINGNPYEGLSVDLWSCGIILYAMLCGYLPFDDQSDEILYKKITEGKFTIPSIISSEAKNLIKRMLVTDPSKRLSLDQIRNHPWFNISSHVKNDGLFINYHIIPVDLKIVDTMRRAGYNPEEVKEMIIANKHNNLTTLYYLLIKKSQKVGIPSISDLMSREFLDYIQDKKNILTPSSPELAKKKSGLKATLTLQSDTQDQDIITTETNYAHTIVTTQNGYTYTPTDTCQADIIMEDYRVQTEREVIDEKDTDEIYHDTEKDSERINKNTIKNYFKTEVSETDYFKALIDSQIESIKKNIPVHYRKITNFSMKNKLKEQYERYVKKDIGIAKKMENTNNFNKGFLETSASFEKNTELRNRTFTIDNGKEQGPAQLNFKLEDFSLQRERSQPSQPLQKGIAMNSGIRYQTLNSTKELTNGPLNEIVPLHSDNLQILGNLQQKKLSKKKGHRSCPEIQEANYTRAIYVIKEDEEFKKKVGIKNGKAPLVPKEGEIAPLSLEETNTERSTLSLQAFSGSINKPPSHSIHSNRCVSEPSDNMKNISKAYGALCINTVGTNSDQPNNIQKESVPNPSPFQTNTIATKKERNRKDILNLDFNISSYSKINRIKTTMNQNFHGSFIKSPTVNMNTLLSFPTNQIAYKKSSHTQKSSSIPSLSGKKSTSTINSTINEIQYVGNGSEEEILIHKGPFDLSCTTMKKPIKIKDDLLAALKKNGITYLKPWNAKYKYKYTCQKGIIKFEIEICKIIGLPDEIFFVKFFRQDGNIKQYKVLCKNIWSLLNL